MTPPTGTSVLIVGGGPVGLAAAVELGTRGIDCVVLEPRATISSQRPRAKTTSVRTMEHFRRWGIADRIRAAAALPVSWSQRVVVATGLLGPELTSFDDCFGLSVTKTEMFAESGQQIPQPAVERVLRDVVSELPTVRLAVGWSLGSLTESGHQVVVEAVAADGARWSITAQYVLGCDGGNSRTRECLGIPMVGPIDARQNTTFVFRAPGLAEQVPHSPAVHYWIFNARAVGAFGRFDLTDTWWMSSPSSDRDPALTMRGLLGSDGRIDVDYEILCTDTWQARMQLAQTFHTDRVFLVGDAAHLTPPWGGHGFNTGIGDAVNIGWKLAATLQGWGGHRLLHSYGAERRAIAASTITAATANMTAMRHCAATSDELDAVGPVGDRARRALGEVIHRAMDAEFHSLGLVLGYEYTDSPHIVYDDTSGIERNWDPTVYIPSTRPGARLPHSWLADGRSVYDTLGTGLTLLTFEGTGSVAIVDAARRQGIPLAVVDLSDVDLCCDDQADMLLVRPDQHIAWRGKQMPPDSVDVILDRILGRGTVSSLTNISAATGETSEACR
jgi:2-polyprenyl-6-methoxyphenol hydroxylase-like FAD-dependent oxidoreductase